MRSVLKLAVLVVFGISSLPLASVAYGQAAALSTSATSSGCGSARTSENGSGSSRTVRSHSLCLSVDQAGSYRIASQSSDLALSGKLPSAASKLAVTNGKDAIGTYREIRAEYGSEGRTAVFRLYEDQPAVLLIDRHRGADSNNEPFPSFGVEPAGLLRAGYKVYRFAPIDFGKLDSEGPWLFFDHERHTIVLSPADNFLVSDLKAGANGAMSSGIAPEIATLPAGFSHGTLVAFGNGINSTLSAWGKDLQELGHKKPIPNDADVVLNKFGYWTDNGAYYYYKFEPKLRYEGTLLAVRNQYQKLGVPIAYMQLDSWWYPKERGDNPHGDNGEVVYRADPSIFPDGLDSFHKRLGLPMATHARWVAADSPYRKQYKMSKNVIIDPRFWSSTAEYLKNGGVMLYEQDWLDHNARPAINIAQSHEFLAMMSKGMAQKGIAIQYCMALPAYFLASTQFQNVRTIRVSDDRFSRSRWDWFLYASALAHSVGLWPWSDVFMSNETGNLVLSTLSAGPVGTGDALDAIDAANLKRVMRSDSVILKPDTPLKPVDAMYVADAAESPGTPTEPMVAETSTDFGSATEHYVFSFPRIGVETSATIPLSELGITGPVYAWDWSAQKGKVIQPEGGLDARFVNGWDYGVLAPINQAGIALLGDVSKIVPLARKRFSSVQTSGGAIEATLVFAPGESSVEVTGYARSHPSVRAVSGKVDELQYDSKTHLFTFHVSPASGDHARIRIS